MKTYLIVSFFSFSAITILAVTPTNSPRNKRKNSDEPNTITSNVVSAEADIISYNSIEKEEEFAEAPSIPPFKPEIDYHFGQYQTENTKKETYERQIEAVAQYQFEGNKPISIKYPQASRLTISLNSAETHFAIAGNKDIYLYSTANGTLQGKPIIFEDPIANTQFVDDTIVKVTLSDPSNDKKVIVSKTEEEKTKEQKKWWDPSIETDTAPIQPDTFEKVQRIETFQRTYKDIYVNIISGKQVQEPHHKKASITSRVNLTLIPYVQTTFKDNPMIFAKKVIPGKNYSISIVGDKTKPIEILLHKTDTFHKTKYQLQQFIEKNVPIFVQIFEKWKRNKPEATAFFEDINCPIKGELKEALQELNQQYPWTPISYSSYQRSATPPPLFPEDITPPPLYEMWQIGTYKQTEDNDIG
jgi:hypothetical protein